MARAGATLIELGIPFSDPMADGPVIQRASERALRHSLGVDEILQTVAAARNETNVPIILFSYFNPLLQWCQRRDAGEAPALPANGSELKVGFEVLAKEASAAGIDGVLVTDLVPEEAGDFSAILRAYDLDLIFLVAPTSTDERLQMIAARASGFVYAVSRAGVTGARTAMSAEAEKLVKRIRQFSSLPVAVGFGISTAEQVRDVWRYADAAVVGSAIVSVIEKSDSGAESVQKVGEFARKLLRR